jgi:folate-binding protein YgfZ
MTAWIGELQRTMTQTLRDYQHATGAQVEGQAIATFGQDEAARQALPLGVAVCDRSHWGRISLTGEDRIRFLHNQTTNNIQRLQSGQGCDTVFVTSTARTLDLATVYLLESEILVVTHPTCRESLQKWMDRFIFPFDKVGLRDQTDATVMFSVLGEGCAALLEELGVGAIASLPLHSHQVVTLAGVEVRIAVGSGLVTPGYTLIADQSAGLPLWQALNEAGAIPFGETLWEQLRIEQGRPVPGQELTDDYNPLEAGLWHTASFSKGCYIGQETIARLDTYKGVKQQLWGIHLAAIAPVGSTIFLGEEKIGKLTSVTETTSGITGLAYLRTKAGGAGLTVTVGEGVTGTIVEIPFATRDRQPEPA